MDDSDSHSSFKQVLESKDENGLKRHLKSEGKEKKELLLEVFL